MTTPTATTNPRKKFGNSIASQHLASSLQHQFNMKHVTQEMFNTLTAKQQRNLIVENNFLPDDELNLDVSSPREINSPSFGLLSKNKDGQDKLTRKRDKQKAKEDEKIEKRRLKEEKLKRNAEKEREREKKKQDKMKQTKQNSSNANMNLQSMSQTLIEDFAQSDTNPIPLFLEKCVRFIEDEGLDSEGIYRVPGNRAHVELLFQKFEEGKSFFFFFSYSSFF